MLGAAVARPERDQAGVFGIGERDTGLGDALQPGFAADRLNTAAASIEVRSPRRANSAASAVPGRRTRAAGKREASFARATAASAPPLAGPVRAEPGRLRSERGCRVGKIADHRGRQIRRNRDRQCA